MKEKVLFMMAALIVSMTCAAQSLVDFHLTPDGSFVTEDGADFVVVEYEGKTAHQIFQELASNVGSIYNNPSKVMSTVDDASIKIRAMEDFLVNSTLGIPVGTWQGYYQLEFRIKDGRVRVQAPYIEPYFQDSNHKKPQKSYTKHVKGLFKNGEVKDNKKDEYLRFNYLMNGTINAILGSNKPKVEEDW